MCFDLRPSRNKSNILTFQSSIIQKYKFWQLAKSYFIL